MAQAFGIHKIPDEHIIYQTECSFIFVNIRPFLKHHILISPKRIVDRVYGLTEFETKDLFECVRFCSIAMKNIFTGYTINIQDGVDAGQKVFHVHVHFVPRSKNDLKVNNEIYASGNLDYDREDRSFIEMKEEAMFLRSLFLDAKIEKS